MDKTVRLLIDLGKKLAYTESGLEQQRTIARFEDLVEALETADFYVNGCPSCEHPDHTSCAGCPFESKHEEYVSRLMETLYIKEK